MWSLKHTVECRATAHFAWRYWTTVANWASVDSSIDSVEIDGAFVTGARGTTVTSSQDRVGWLVAEVVEASRARIEFAVAGAVLSTEWTFESAGPNCCEITQQLALFGARASKYEAVVASEMQVGVPAGMRALAAGIDVAFRAASQGDGYRTSHGDGAGPCPHRRRARRRPSKPDDDGAGQ